MPQCGSQVVLCDLAAVRPANNRLRGLGDSRTCCGIDGLVNFRATLNTLYLVSPVATGLDAPPPTADTEHASNAGRRALDSPRHPPPCAITPALAAWWRACRVSGHLFPNCRSTRPVRTAFSIPGMR
jgi:hypothetical protein